MFCFRLKDVLTMTDIIVKCYIKSLHIIHYMICNRTETPPTVTFCTDIWVASLATSLQLNFWSMENPENYFNSNHSQNEANWLRGINLGKICVILFQTIESGNRLQVNYPSPEFQCFDLLRRLGLAFIYQMRSSDVWLSELQLLHNISSQPGLSSRNNFSCLFITPACRLKWQKKKRSCRKLAKMIYSKDLFVGVLSSWKPFTTAYSHAGKARCTQQSSWGSILYADHSGELSGSRFAWDHIYETHDAWHFKIMFRRYSMLGKLWITTHLNVAQRERSENCQKIARPQD